MTDAREALDTLLEATGVELDGANVVIPNVAPDEGLSAPFNSWFTLFGQFFDHGLDLVNKGGSGTVFIPLQPDDPLYDPASSTNFMVLTRATVSPGADGVMGTADDVRPVNTTTSFVDQNQTYTSHSSHQVFLRQYALNADGDPVATGKLIEGGNGGMATWADVKAQALTARHPAGRLRRRQHSAGRRGPVRQLHPRREWLSCSWCFRALNPGDPPRLVEGTADGLAAPPAPSAPATRSSPTSRTTRCRPAWPTAISKSAWAIRTIRRPTANTTTNCWTRTTSPAMAAPTRTSA